MTTIKRILFSYRLPLRLLGGDGRPRYLMASFQRVEIGGRPHAVSLIQDLSEFHRLRNALTQSEQRFRLFFENAPLALVVSDNATNEIVAVNPAACRQYGYSRADFLNAPSERVVPLLTTSPGVAQHTTATGHLLDVETTPFFFARRACQSSDLT